jgi:uncharacterized protein
VTRDRDPAGRPRTARPRDALGRPLDRTGNRAAGEARIPDDLQLAGPDAARLADELLRAGRPFHAHEVLEAAWKSGPAHERDLWQGLAQVAVGLTHACRGNARGAVTLLRRGTQRVRAYQGQSEPPGDGDRPYGIDLAAFLAASDDLAERIEQNGLAGITAADLRPGLMALRKAGHAELVTSPGGGGRGELRARAGVGGYLGRGEREAGIGHPYRGREHDPVHGALG